MAESIQFNRPGDTFIVKLKGNEAGGGKYACSVHRYLSESEIPGLLDPAADLGSVTLKCVCEDAIFANLSEAGTSGHLLLDDFTARHIVAKYVGMSTDHRPVLVGSEVAIEMMTCMN